MTSGLFSSKTLGRLREAGWREDRDVNTEPFRQQFRAEGHRTNKAALDFLQRFGDLELTYVHQRVPTAVENCHFDAARAATDVFSENVHFWEEKIGEAMCPIGEARSGYLTLLMTEKGEVFAGVDDLLFRVAPSGEEAINVLCEGRDFEDVE